MDDANQDTSVTTRLVLEPILGLEVTAALKSALSDAFHKGDFISLDASEVLEGSTAAAQTLSAAALEAEKTGKILEVCNPTDEFMSLFQELGLFEVFFTRVIMS